MEKTPRIALTREPSPRLAECELTFLPRTPIDFVRAREQHRQYQYALSQMGLEVQELPPLDECPDGTFVEDTAIILDEVAILGRPASPSRAREIGTVERALADHRRLLYLTGGATLDGGDVLVVGRDVFVGLSGRTNRVAMDELETLLRPDGYRVRCVRVRGCLHLKTACTYIGRGTMLINRAWIDWEALQGFELLDVDPDEPFAANTLRVGEQVLHSSAHCRTTALLSACGFAVRSVGIAELEKAEAGVTCLSLLV